MEMKVSFLELAAFQSPRSPKYRKCRHYEHGYCKLKADCVYVHLEEVCEKYLETRVSRSKNVLSLTTQRV